MISLYKKKKSKNEFITCEDSLTSSVFDLIKYLPSDVILRILKNSLLHDKIPADAGELLTISFWDKWSSENTANSRYVEPDVFMRFTGFDVILEAKRYDYFQQYSTQIDNEIQAYYNEFSSDGKELYFVQLGGIYSKSDEEDILINYDGQKTVKMCKTTWTVLLNTVSAIKTEILLANITSELHVVRVLDDIISAFEMHQFYEIMWLKEISKENVLQNNFDFFSYPPKSSVNWLSDIKCDKINYTSTNILFTYANA